MIVTGPDKGGKFAPDQSLRAATAPALFAHAARSTIPAEKPEEPVDMDVRASRYHDIYAHWQRTPEVFWAEAAADLHWYEKPKTIFDKDAGIYGRWFAGGVTNTCYNCLDRQVANGRNDQVALIYDSPVTKTVQSFTYGRMLSEVQLLGAILRVVDAGGELLRRAAAAHVGVHGADARAGWRGAPC